LNPMPQSILSPSACLGGFHAGWSDPATSLDFQPRWCVSSALAGWQKRVVPAQINGRLQRSPEEEGYGRSERSMTSRSHMVSRLGSAERSTSLLAITMHLPSALRETQPITSTYDPARRLACVAYGGQACLELAAVELKKKEHGECVCLWDRVSLTMRRTTSRGPQAATGKRRWAASQCRRPARIHALHHR